MLNRPLEITLADALRAAFPGVPVEVIALDAKRAGEPCAALKCGSARVIITGAGSVPGPYSDCIHVWPSGDADAVTHHGDVAAAVEAVRAILPPALPDFLHQALLDACAAVICQAFSGATVHLEPHGVLAVSIGGRPIARITRERQWTVTRVDGDSPAEGSFAPFAEAADLIGVEELVRVIVNDTTRA